MLIHSWQNTCPSVTKAPGFPVFISNAKILQKNLFVCIGKDCSWWRQSLQWSTSCSIGAKKLQRQLLLPFPCCMPASSPAERWDQECIGSAGCIQHTCKAASSGSGCGKIRIYPALRNEIAPLSTQFIQDLWQNPQYRTTATSSASCHCAWGQEPQ